ncbi:MAG: 2OG-Fe(II) oxygenase [Gammaproteobacteria bacterium]|nr:2OG-Fe(II) oxygenase [Gammaproteobacteria bacterium]
MSHNPPVDNNVSPTPWSNTLNASIETENHTPLSLLKEVKPGSFIFEQRGALSLDSCRNIIQRFEKAEEEQYPGRIGQGAAEDFSIKQSTDLVISGKSHWHDIDRLLFHSLGRAIVDFRKTYGFFNGPFKDMGYALQRTAAQQFYHWHIDGGSHEFADRQLVALWYLNDVEGPGGTTDFRFQDVQVKPEAGKLILFPPFWTHEHRGAVLEQGVKYIATTWVVFA